MNKNKYNIILERLKVKKNLLKYPFCGRKFKYKQVSKHCEDIWNNIFFLNIKHKHCITKKKLTIINHIKSITKKK